MTFEELKKHKPTIQWVENDINYDFYSVENINATNEVLDSLIDNLEKLGANPHEEEILKIVKEVVIKLNELNEQYDDYIETGEREDLWEFIDAAARTAGLNTDGKDITEDWREW